tara:strand:+ start:2345 stop:2620 length:276 start_codon:yes stop_codon:yes gene_type:complete
MWELDYIEVIGLLAAVLTTSSFAPQVYHTWKTKDVAGLSLTMYLAFFTGVVLWTIYGVHKDSLAIILANFITGILVLVLLILKIKYGKSKK